ncbi:MAG TPA: hypothetical protein VE567_06710, partial [Sphingomonas sp.]|nr:hypothetical protein [Sphingomonas sp.]
SWAVRLMGLSPVIKLAVIPLLIDQFERSGRGHWTLIAFVASCSLLMGFSWLDYLVSGLHIATDKAPAFPSGITSTRARNSGWQFSGLRRYC